METMIIRSEIEKFKTEQCYINQKGVAIIPTKAVFMEHIAADKTLKPAPLIFVTEEGKEFKVVILELDCSGDGTRFFFFGYCDFINYGRTENDIVKNGSGLRLISGKINFKTDGTPHLVFLNAMKEGCYNR